MAIKLKKIVIKDFKVFKHIEADFTSKDLIVFDGPNGFGKSSFFDAIELLLTGSIRRYQDLAKKTVDNREVFSENPFIRTNGTNDLVIKASLDIDGTEKILMRKGVREKLDTITNVRDFKLCLHELTGFDNENVSPIENEEGYLTEIFGKNYCENFQFLNYIEQEENTYLLKHTSKERRGKIDHIFNTSNFEKIIAKIALLAKKIGELCNTQENKNLQELKNNVISLKKAIAHDAAVDYRKIVNWKSLNWDQENIEFKDGRYAELVGDDGILEKIKLFVINFKEFKNDRYNSELSQLTKNKLALERLLLYHNFMDDIARFRVDMARQKECLRLIKEFSKGTLQAVLDNKCDIKPLIKDAVLPNVNIADYMEYKNTIIKLHKELDYISEITTTLKDSRKALIENFRKFEEATSTNKECPLCGFDWKTARELNNALKKKAAQFNELSKETEKKINDYIAKYESDFILPIKLVINQYLLEYSVDDKFVSALEKIENFKPTLMELFNKLVSLDIKFNDLLNKNPSHEAKAQLNELQNLINAKKLKINYENIKPYYKDIFLEVFNEDEKKISNITTADIESKKKYLRWQHSLWQSQSLKKLTELYGKQQDRFREAKELKAKISSVKKIYDISKDEYQKKLIGDIEMLFHVYSGRIMQDCQGGLGLFISHKSGIRFLENPAKSHDATFSVSSGQLATLIISFTLALNKKYSQNKILFIDDPIQTLDELNIAGLVELLRNEFNDRQIFISTHENDMSAYIRYKFEKFKLKHKQINFKTLFLSPVT